MTMPCRTLALRHGGRLNFSVLGFGGAPLGNMHRPLTEPDARDTVEAAWAAGMRYFDTAPLYGHGLSERRLGAVLRALPRGAFVLSTKVGWVLEPCAPGDEDSGIYVDTPHFRVRFDYSYEGVMRSFEESLKRLGLNRIDILHVHDVDAPTHGSREAADRRIQQLFDEGGWRALADLRSDGAVSAIGIGVNECEACERILELADPDIFLLAGRYTLLDQSALETLLPACLADGVGVVIGGPYNSGILATDAVPGAQYNYAPASPEILRRTRNIEGICAGFGTPLVDAALHFPLSHPAVVSVIPGSQTADEVRNNTRILTNPSHPSLWQELARAGLIPQGIGPVG
jgi:D-threo-aldose 1-dehydrogenase